MSQPLVPLDLESVEDFACSAKGHLMGNHPDVPKAIAALDGLLKALETALASEAYQAYERAMRFIEECEPVG